MSDYTFTEQELSELKEIFFSEAYEIIQSLGENILIIESGQERDRALKDIQRYLHTLKGNSRALGFACINTLSHATEDLVRRMQDNATALDKGHINLLLAIHDRLHQYVDSYRINSVVSTDEKLIKRIEVCLRISTDDNRSAQPSRGAMEDSASCESVPVVPGASGDAPIETRDAGSVGQPSAPAASFIKSETASTFRVDAQRIDKILNLVGELVIGRSIIGQVLSDMDERQRKDVLTKRLIDAHTFMEKTLSQLQKNVMKIRMLPISQVFRKFPRVVRDLSIEKNKEITLVLDGENTELDKGILDVIGEPLIHLVRNAIDHGIEPPADRESAGKPRNGTITLRASHQGNQIVIEVGDDGAGIDPGRIRKKAVEKGMRTLEEAERMSDEEALDLIFLSGFSTAERVTDISGRGFGMDIVRATIESLRGRIQVRSRIGEGTMVTLRLPLTLAIIRAMLFRAGNRLFALPMSSIEKIMRMSDRDSETIAGRRVLRLRDKVISLIPAKETLGIEEDGVQVNGRKFVIIVGLAEKLYGVVVDKLLGQQELVIKALDDHWGAINCASGASILGNGTVVIILDAPALIAKEMRRQSKITVE